MIIPFYLFIIVAIAISALICFGITMFIRKGKDAKVGIGCFWMFPITIVSLIVIYTYLPHISVITKYGDEFKIENKCVLFNYKMQDGKTFPIKLGCEYIANETDDPLILYPVYYGPTEKEYKVHEEEPELFEPKSLAIHIHKIDRFFEPPLNQISSESKNIEVRWIIESLPQLYQREINNTDYSSEF